MSPPNKLTFEKDKFLIAVQQCSSIRDLCRYYSKPINGYYAALFRKQVESFGCNTSHFHTSKVKMVCADCGREFEVSVSQSKKRQFCSLKCANQKVRGRALPKADDELVWSRKHRIICFRHHKKECVVCQEDFAVTVHHYNGVHSDDRPENLVPICANHHIYLHSNRRYLVEHIVNDYVKRFISRPVAHSVEQSLDKAEAVGAKPTGATKFP